MLAETDSQKCQVHLNSGTTRLQGHNQLVLLSGKLGVDINYSAALAHSLVDVRLGNRDLLLVFLLVLAKLGAPWGLEIRLKNLRMLQFRSQSLLEVGFDQHPDLEPLPGLSQQIGTQGPLARVQRQFLSSAKMSLNCI